MPQLVLRHTIQPRQRHGSHRILDIHPNGHAKTQVRYGRCHSSRYLNMVVKIDLLVLHTNVAGKEIRQFFSF